MKNKCTKELIEKVRILVESGLSWRKIAAAVGLSESILHAWKQEGSATYNAEFAGMVTQALEDRDLGKIKAGQVEQAQKHILIKVTKELRAKGPKRPPSNYTKEMLRWYCEEILRLELDPAMDLKEMWYHIDRRIEELTEEEMVVTKTEKAEVDPNQAAVKNVLTNTGTKDKRWSFKEEHEVEPGNALTKLLSEIGRSKAKLPSQEDGI